MAKSIDYVNKTTYIIDSKKNEKQAEMKTTKRKEENTKLSV